MDKKVKKLSPRTDAQRREKQARHFSRILRTLEIIRKDGCSVKELAKINNCTERSVYRDIAVIREAGVDIIFDKITGCYKE